MVHVKIIISEIDYEKSFANLFPMALKKCSVIENPNMAVRFLKKMGDASMTAALGVMNQMAEQDKGKLLCALLNLYSDEIQKALKMYLEKNEIGKNVKVGDVFLTQDETGRLALLGYDIRINYSGLADNSHVQEKIKGIAGNMVGGVSKIGWLKEAAADSAGFAAKAAAQLAPGKVEKLGISFLEKPENKKKLITWAAQTLTGKGVCLTLEDCFFVQDEDLETWDVNKQEKDRRAFPEELEDALMDAVVGYLKILLKDSEPVENDALRRHMTEYESDNSNLKFRKQKLKFFPEDEEKMKHMDIKERIEYQRILKQENRFVIED